MSISLDKMYSIPNCIIVILLLLLNYTCLRNINIECCDLNSTHALILARAGSKGIPNKNMLIIDGKTILGRTIETIKASKSFANIWVSTDSFLIAMEALKYGASIYWRSPVNAQDNSSSIAAIHEFLNAHYFIHRFALFQCTSPFLRVSYILQAVQKFSSAHCVFAVKRSHELRWTLKEGKHLNVGVKPLNFELSRRRRRQDWDGELVETGMFYFSTRNLVMKNILQDESCLVLEIKARDAIELDNYDDIEMARCLMKL